MIPRDIVADPKIIATCITKAPTNWYRITRIRRITFLSLPLDGEVKMKSKAGGGAG